MYLSGPLAQDQGRRTMSTNVLRGLPEGSPTVSPQSLTLQQRAVAGGRRGTAPLPSTPELQQFINAVIIPALLERLLREHS